METIREFIEEAVEEYNSGKLTTRKLSDMFNTYEVTLCSEHQNKHQNLLNAYRMLEDTFTEQKGKKISKKVDFDWSENKKYPNPCHFTPIRNGNVFCKKCKFPKGFCRVSRIKFSKMASFKKIP